MGAGDKAKSLVVQQVARWLASSPEEKTRYMDERSVPVELTDISHPAYRRSKEVLEPLGLRKKEQALQFCKVKNTSHMPAVMSTVTVPPTPLSLND